MVPGTRPSTRSSPWSITDGHQSQNWQNFSEVNPTCSSESALSAALDNVISWEEASAGVLVQHNEGTTWHVAADMVQVQPKSATAISIGHATRFWPHVRHNYQQTHVTANQTNCTHAFWVFRRRVVDTSHVVSCDVMSCHET